jgi:hypothetical protein
MVLKKVSRFNQIVLDVSKLKLKLEAENMYLLEIDFKAPINSDDVQATWKKKSKELSIILKKL